MKHEKRINSWVGILMREWRLGGGGKLRISWWRKEVRQPRGSGLVEIGEGKEGMEG